MKNISYSAPAKVILTGEHAVLYGKPALATAISLWLTATVEDREEQNPISQKIINTVLAFVAEKKYEIMHKGGSLTIDSQIPIGRGLGSSAALSVASVAALLEWYTGHTVSHSEIGACAYRVEKLFHGNPSGIDVSASCFGGLIYYRKEFEFLKNTSCLQVQIPQHIAEKILLIDSGAPIETTAQMVAEVGKLYNKRAKSMAAVFSSIEAISKRMVIALMQKDEEMFVQCISENEHELEKINTVSVQTKKLLLSLKKFGIGKVTGAGGRKSGSGYLLFFSKQIESLKKHLRDRSIAYLSFCPSQDGYKKNI